ncbi:MAG TPA: hypothetical protein VND93_20335, partial [Myxococcales bacterium]|nr:hypothetical protein [Myxococcales bacterium]
MSPEPQPALLERILALRPTSAAHRLGDSPLPVLNPRDLVRALDGTPPVPVLCVPVPAVEALPGLLRAARDQDAVLGLACPYRPGSRDAAGAFFDAVRAAADDYGHRRPVFLQAGPLRITSAEPRGLQERAEDVFRFIDAGFSLLSVDASTLVPEAGVQVAADLVQAASERELSIEIAAPVDSRGRATPEGLQTCLEAFRAKRIDIRFVRLRSSQFLPDSARGAGQGPDLAALGELAAIASSFDAWLSVEEVGSARSPGAWARAGIRKLEVGGPFATVVLGALEPEMRASLRVRAAATSIPLAELLAQFGDPLAEAPHSAHL